MPGRVEVGVFDARAHDRPAIVGHRRRVERVQLLVEERAAPGSRSTNAGPERVVHAEAAVVVDLARSRRTRRSARRARRSRARRRCSTASASRTRSGCASANAVTHQPPIDWPARCAARRRPRRAPRPCRRPRPSQPCTPVVNVELPKPRQSHVIDAVAGVGEYRHLLEPGRVRAAGAVREHERPARRRRR